MANDTYDPNDNKPGPLETPQRTHQRGRARTPANVGHGHPDPDLHEVPSDRPLPEEN